MLLRKMGAVGTSKPRLRRPLAFCYSSSYILVSKNQQDVEDRAFHAEDNA
jgi:hypothetical protein